VDNLLARDLDHVLDHTRDLWSDLRGERLFITGGTGFIGCWILESLCWAIDRLQLNTKAVVLTRSPECFHQRAPHLAGHGSIELWRGDVRSYAYPRGQFSQMIHAATAASATSGASATRELFDTIVDGARHTLAHAAECGAKNYLLTSSGAVYGRQPPEMRLISEDYTGGPSVQDPNSAYAEGERAAELLCALASESSRLQCKIARGFAFVGPYLPLDQHFAVGNFLANALQDVPIEIKGDGAAYRSYLHAADLAIWLWTILLRGESGRAYNVGSDDAVSIADLAREVASVASSKSEVRIAKSPDPNVAPERYVPDISRARQELGLDAFLPRQAALERTLEWHRSRAEAIGRCSTRFSPDAQSTLPVSAAPHPVEAKRPLISVVTPCFNEEENVEPIYEAVRVQFEKLGKYRYEHIFIDNNSTDSTANCLRKVAAADRNVRVILNARNFGQIRSPMHALYQTRGEAVIGIVADFQDPPELIPEYLSKWEAGYKIVLSVKSDADESRLMYHLRKSYYKLLAKLSDVQLIVNATGAGLLDRKVVDAIKEINDPYPYFRGLLAEIGYEVYTIPYKQPRRRRGITKNNFYSLYDLAMLGFVSHSKVPIRLATMFGFGLSFLSLITAIVYFFMKLLFWYRYPAGAAPTLIGMFLFFSVQLFFTGLLGEYIVALVTNAQRRPLVFERERINFNVAD